MTTKRCLWPLTPHSCGVPAEDGNAFLLGFYLGSAIFGLGWLFI